MFISDSNGETEGSDLSEVLTRARAIKNKLAEFEEFNDEITGLRESNRVLLTPDWRNRNQDNSAQIDTNRDRIKKVSELQDKVGEELAALLQPAPRRAGW